MLLTFVEEKKDKISWKMLSIFHTLNTTFMKKWIERLNMLEIC